LTTLPPHEQAGRPGAGRHQNPHILRSSYLAKLTPELLASKMTEHKLDPGKLMADGVLAFNKDTENDMLLLLNEDLWTGDFSGDLYAAARKQQQRPDAQPRQDDA
jgi:hypothetical protein